MTSIGAFLMSFVGGIIGGFFWMGILWAIFRHRHDADVIAFRAMTIFLLISLLLFLAFPNLALDRQRALVVTIGYVLVMAWFWRSRGLRIVGKSLRVAGHP